jgi:hypothetical protein|nr:MAG TPA: hypothetical protein [Caudoviricetes sp.]
MVSKSILDKLKYLNTAKAYYLYCFNNLDNELKNNNITLNQVLNELSLKDLEYIEK